MPAASGRSGVLAAGVFLVDVIKTVRQWPAEESVALIESVVRSNGGGAYNVLCNLSRLLPSLPLEAAGTLGEDELGRVILDDCRARSIGTRWLQTDPNVATSFADVVAVRESARRTFFHHPGGNAVFDGQAIDFSATNAAMFYLGYPALLPRLCEHSASGRPRAVDLLDRARCAGLVTVVDCVATTKPSDAALMQSLIPISDLFFCNEREAGDILGQKVEPGLGSLRHAAKQLQARNDQTVIVHSVEGAAAVVGSESILQPAVRIPAEAIVGSNGAGDALVAGYLAAQLSASKDWTEEDGLRAGICVAAQSLTSSTPSDGLTSLAECCRLAAQFGFA